MGLFSALNHLWSNADFWDKQENARQNAAYAQQQEEERRRQQQQQQAQAAANARPQQPTQPQTTVSGLFGNNPLALHQDSQNPTVPQVNQPGDSLQPKQLPSFNEAIHPGTTVTPTIKNPYTGEVSANPFAANPQTGQMNGFHPQKGQPGYEFTPEGQADLKAQAQAAAHAKAVVEAQRFQHTAPKEGFWGKVANFVPILGSQRQLGTLEGVDSGDPIQEDVSIAKNTGLSLDQIHQMTPEQRQQTLDQLHKGYNFAKGASVADIGMTAAIPLTGGLSLGLDAGAQGGKEVALALARKLAQDYVSKEGLTRAGVAGGVGMGIDAGAQQYTTGHIDPASVVRSGITSSALGWADPFAAFGGKHGNPEEAAGRPPVVENNGIPQTETPPVAPSITEPPEVAPGVKAPNLMKPQEESPVPTATPTVPTVRPTSPTEPLPTPTPTPTVPRTVEPPTLPSLERQTPATQGAVPTGVTHSVPTVQTISPEIRKAVDQAKQQVLDSGEQLPVKPQKPVAAPVETPTKAVSEDVAAKTAPTAPAEVVKAAETAPAPVETTGKHPDVAFAEKQVQAAQERLDYLKRSGEPTKQAEAELKAAQRDLQTTKAEVGSAPATQPTEKLPSNVTADHMQVPAPKKTAPIKNGEVKIVKPADKTVAPVEKTVPVSPETEKPNVAKSNATPVKPKAAPAPKAEKVAAPTKEELAQHAQDVYHDAQQNTTKGGKVTKAWKDKAMAEAGTDPTKLEAVRSAVEKIEGRKVADAPVETKPVESGGVAKSGEIGIGQGAESEGKMYEKTSEAANAKQGQQKLASEGAHNFLKRVESKFAEAKPGKEGDVTFSATDRNMAVQLRKQFQEGTVQHDLLSNVIANVHQGAAQVLSTAQRVFRETASEDELINRLIDRSKLVNRKMNLTNADLADVRARTKAFIEARSKANDAQDAYLADPSSVEKQQAALDAAKTKQQLDKEQKVAELKAIVSKSGDRKSQKEMYKLIDKLGKEADVWQMDYVDSSLLSSTGTWTNNFINSGLAGIEESLFGRVGAKVARMKTGTDIGGGGILSRKSQKFGLQKLGSEFQARKGLPSKNIAGKGLNALKNLITTANELGNTQIDAESHASVKAEYMNILKKEYPDRYGKDMTPAAKKELEMRAEYNATVDPRDLRQKYTDFAFKVQGMGSVFGKGGKSRVSTWENNMTKGMSQAMQNVRVPKSVADNAAKLTMRSLVGFPSIVSRSAAQGANRLTLGIPTFIRATGVEDPVERAMLIKQGVKEMGSGGAMLAAGYAAGMSGMVTGAYPSDKTTQDEWAKEGKSEHSVKIGNSYYSIPRALGPFAIPFMVGSQLGSNDASGDNGGFGKTMVGVVENIGAATPISQLNDNINTVDKLMTGDTSTATKNAEKIAGNMLRVTAPASGMLNEIAQDTSKNQKDTTSDSPVEAVLNKLYAGLPMLNQHLPDKTSKDGTPIKNTDALARAAGAQSSENAPVVAKDTANKKANASSLSPIVSDKEIYGLLDKNTQHLIDQANNPKTAHEVNDQNFQSIYKAVEKTTDVLAEKGSWDSYGKTLQLKLDNQNKDKSVAQADKDATQRQITQAQILKDNKIEADIFHLYSAGADKGGISESDFKKMLDPQSTYYDKTTAEKLWQLDQLFTEKGVSGNTTGALNPWMHQKYALPTGGSGGSGGGKGKNEIATDFGTVKSVGGSSPISGQAIKATQLADFNDLVPNLSKQTSSTNLRKTIHATKGVAIY